MSSFQNKNIWIIGASGGIGKALAIELDAQGARLALSARRRDPLRLLNIQLRGRHSAYPLDVTDGPQIHSAAAQILEQHGRIDCVMFLADTCAPCCLEKLDPVRAKQAVDTTLNGAFNTLHAVLPLMRRQKSGQIVLCGGAAGHRGRAGGQPCGATRAAIINLAQSLRAEESRYGIDVRLINPGFARALRSDERGLPPPRACAPEAAAKSIVKGLKSRRFEIHLPRRFTYTMRLIRFLPSILYFPLVRAMT